MFYIINSRKKMSGMNLIIKAEKKYIHYGKVIKENDEICKQWAITHNFSCITDQNKQQSIRMKLSA